MAKVLTTTTVTSYIILQLVLVCFIEVLFSLSLYMIICCVPVLVFVAGSTTHDTNQETHGLGNTSYGLELAPGRTHSYLTNENGISSCQASCIP